MLVVGGGITGAGVALDAASRGLRTALVERDDFASGTSSKSSKLVHGGLRYLQQRRGRARLRGARRAPAAAHATRPHLVRVLPFLLPVFTARRPAHRRSSPARSAPRCGCTTSPAGCASASCTSASSRTRRSRTCRRCPPTGSPASYLYYDAQADDARLTLDDRPHRAPTTAPSVANYARARRPRQGRRRPGQRRARSTPTATRSTCAAAVVVNATGVWSDDVRALDEGTPPATRSGRPRASTSPCRGRRCATTSPSSIPVPKDRRSVFVVPWGRPRSPTSAPPTPTTTARSTTRSARPTTSRTCSRAINDVGRRPTITEADIARHVGRAAPARAARRRARRTADLSRRHRCTPSAERRRHRHRRQAHDLPRAWPPTPSTTSCKLLEPARGRAAAPSSCALHGADGLRRRRPTAPSRRAHLADRYGGEARDVRRHARRATRRSAEPLVPGLPYLARRGRVRRPRRDGPHRRRRALAPHPGPAAGPRRVGRGGADDVAALHGRRARAGTTPSASARSRRTGR